MFYSNSSSRTGSSVTLTPMTAVRKGTDDTIELSVRALAVYSALVWSACALNRTLADDKTQVIWEWIASFSVIYHIESIDNDDDVRWCLYYLCHNVDQNVCFSWSIHPKKDFKDYYERNQIPTFERLLLKYYQSHRNHFLDRFRLR